MVVSGSSTEANRKPENTSHQYGKSTPDRVCTFWNRKVLCGHVLLLFGDTNVQGLFDRLVSSPSSANDGELGGDLAPESHDQPEDSSKRSRSKQNLGGKAAVDQRSVYQSWRST